MQRIWRLKAEKWAIWIVLIAIIVLLRHLLPVIFFTFVLSYIGNTVVQLLTRRWGMRRLNLCAVYLVFLVGVTGIALLVVPRMFSEARQLAVFYVEDAAQAAAGPAVVPPPGIEAVGDETMLDRHTRRYVEAILTEVLGRDTFRTFQRSEAYADLIIRVEDSIRGFIPTVVAGVKEFVNSSISIVFQFLLAIILSFLILWDLASLKRGVQSLQTGSTAEIYAEIAPGMSAFGAMLGRAFEAQTGIAVVNAILTSIGFLILGIPSIALLATIVFFCSYIPVVGVIISTAPAALFAFKAGGITLVLWLVVMILVVHAIEAYALNPMIYGHHMKMHPVAILAILLVGEHLFGIWGLILGVPIAAFFWTYVIHGQRVGGATATVPEPATEAVNQSPAAARAAELTIQNAD
jgi:predicted PurR-regulated permease PerM